MTSNSLCTDAYISQIQQREQLVVFQTFVAPVRFTPPDPYRDVPGISPAQLAMRRKADILKYRSNGDNSAAKRFAGLAKRGNVVYQHLSPSIANSGDAYSTCDVGNPASVGASGVPYGGDTDVLYLDLNVPQYMYEDPRLSRNYATYIDLPPPFMDVYYAPGAVPTITSSNSGSSSYVFDPATWATIRLNAPPPAQLQLTVPLTATITYTPHPDILSGSETDTTVTVTSSLVLFYNNNAAVTVDNPTTYTVQLRVPFSTVSITVTRYLGDLDVTAALANSSFDAIYTARVKCSIQLSENSAQTTTTITGSVAANVAASRIVPSNALITSIEPTPPNISNSMRSVVLL